jgi:ACS family D-galactonate transporter-like MFS transporter
MSSFAVPYALMQIPSGVASDVYGGRRALIYALFFLGISSLMFYFSDSFTTALVIRIVMGASAGVILPATVKLISAWFESHELEKAMGILGLGRVGIILSYMAIPLLMVRYSWRGGVILTAFVPLMVGVLGLIILREPVRAKQNRIKSDRKGFSTYNFRKILNIQTIFLIITHFSGAAVSFGVLTWVPIYLTYVLKAPLVYAGFITAIAGLTGLVGSYSGILIARKWGSKRTIVTSIFMCIVLPSTILLFHQVIGVIIIVALVGLFTMVYFAPLWALVPSSIEKDYEGGAFGIFNTLSFLGAFFAPFLVGYILDMTSNFFIGFVSLSLIAVPGFFTALLLRK